MYILHNPELNKRIDKITEKITDKVEGHFNSVGKIGGLKLIASDLCEPNRAFLIKKGKVVRVFKFEEEEEWNNEQL